MRDCDKCEVMEYNRDLEEECENLSEENRMLKEALKKDMTEEEFLKSILMEHFFKAEESNE